MQVEMMWPHLLENRTSLRFPLQSKVTRVKACHTSFLGCPLIEPGSPTARQAPLPRSQDVPG